LALKLGVTGELSAVVSNDRVRNPEMENDVLDEIHGLPASDFSQGPRRFKPHTRKGQVMGIV
jgi:hypothetical protein